MSHELSLQECQHKWHGTLKSYMIGFFGAVSLTAVSFSLVVFHVLSGNALVYTLVGLALVQAVVQLVFFLHLGQEEKPKLESMVFCFMLLILLIIAGGSLWVMNDLNARMMPQMKSHMEYSKEMTPNKMIQKEMPNMKMHHHD